MSEAAVRDVLELLGELAAADPSPAEAETRRARLQRAHPDVRIELVCDRDALSGDLHVGALVRRPDGAAVSLGVSRARQVPWLLRGAHRWSDRDVVRVNGTVLTMERAIAHLDSMADGDSLRDRLVDSCLLDDHAARAGIEPSDAQVGAALDAFRRTLGLCSAEATRAWMQRHGISHDELEGHAVQRATHRLIREQVAGPALERHFEAHRADHDRVRLVCVATADRPGADQLLAQVRSGAALLELAAAQFTRDGAAPGDPPTLATLYRDDAPAELAAAGLAAAPGALIGPIAVGARFVVAQVLAQLPATLDDATRARVTRRLSDAWLHQQRAAADVHWSWGAAR